MTDPTTEDVPVTPRPGPLQAGAKRLADILVASAVLLVAAVPMALIACAIRLTMGSPVIFRQRQARVVRPQTNSRGTVHG